MARQHWHLAVAILLTLLPLGRDRLQAREMDWNKNSELTQAPVAYHNCNALACPMSPVYELALEKEFWRHVQKEDAPGMHRWLGKAKFYILHWTHRNSRTQQKGRLSMLVSAGHTMLFTHYDLHALVPMFNRLHPAEIGKILTGLSEHFEELPALWHLAESIRWSQRSAQAIPDHANARTFFFSLGAFAQAALPNVAGIGTLPQTLYGPICKQLALPLKLKLGSLCDKKGLSGPKQLSYLDCVDAASCRQVGSGTEGFTAAALLLTLLHEPQQIQTALTMMGDSPEGVALCENFWCSFTNPNDANAEVPEATSIAPFKRIGNLLAIAAAYGKLGQTVKMDRVLDETYREAQRLNWPLMDLLDRTEASLHGGDKARGVPDLLEAWRHPDRDQDFMGLVQFPMPLAAGPRSCASCHFGGVLGKDVHY